MSGSFLIIANPAAGRGAGPSQASQIGELLRATGKRGVVKLTAGPGNAYRLALEAVRDGTEIVVGAGGDATLQEIGRALESTDTALGIIPAGTCNDFARAVGLSRSDSLERLAEVLIRGRPQAVDMGRIGPHRFLTVATFGLISEVNRQVQARALGSRGTLAYLCAALRVLLRYRALPATLRGDFGERSGRFLLAAIGNTASFAGNLAITPGASLSDGLFQVCLLGDVSKLTVLSLMGRLLRGTHLHHSAVTTFQTRVLEIETPSGAGWVCADGESLCQTPCQLEVQPQALRVMMGT